MKLISNGKGKVRTDFQSRKSLFSRLLAQENVMVVHSATVSTATFNLKTRVLTLPNWADNITDDVYDLFCGHETGHALHTPTQQWADDMARTAKKLGVETSQVMPFFQIIEDVRNDKLQTRKYPGLKRIYVNAYGELFVKGFFGNTIKHFMDKINIYYKVGPIQSKIVFDSSEWDLVNRIGDVEKWSDVPKLVEDAWEYCKKNPYGINTRDKSNSDDEDESRYEYQVVAGAGEEDDGETINGRLTVEGEGEGEGDDGSVDAAGESVDADGASEKDAEGEGDDDTDGEEGSDASGDKAGPAPEGSKGGKSKDNKGIPLPVSQVIFDKKQRQTVNQRGGGLSVTVPKSWESKYNDIVVHYKKVLATRKKHLGGVVISSTMVTNFLKNEKSNIDYMVKEFEMRKAADTYARSGIAKTGVLNTNKIFSYPYNEDLFKRVTTVPKGTNHGLVFFLDWSGSMDQIMLPTIKQLLILVTFCRKIGVPFDVYTFLDTGSQHGVGMKLKADNHASELFYAGRFGLLNVLSSSMSSGEMLTAMSHLWGFKNISIEGLGGTPLDPAILFSEHVIKKFKEKHQCQVVTAVYLTDGESSPMTIPSNAEFLVEPKTNQKFFTINKGRLTNVYLRYLKTRLPYVNLLGIKLVSGNYQIDNKMMKVNRPPVTGYDSEYVIRTSALNTGQLKFTSYSHKDSDEDRSVRLEQEFTKGMQSIKENRPFLKAFVESMVEVKKMETETV